MSTKYEWTNSLFIAFTLALCMFILVDINYNERIWEFDSFALKIRVQAILITIVSFYAGSYLFRRIARYFIRKDTDEKRANWKEYLVVFLINFILINIIHLFIMFHVTAMGFKWRESLLINVSASVLLFLYYTMIRNGILSKDLIEQNLQLEKVKVNQLETELKFLKLQYHPPFPVQCLKHHLFPGR
ncbi:MAG: hypothetical protein LUD02_04730 [Tannerellaceae bacterium]|nr:hypothetical protein [Tannerellaceae bacterium]MCD8263541.1 hypothetical protein [Tannerellaceae bacterium]